MIRYLDVCSGYSAFTVANQGLGFECVGYAEIEAFPCALLGHHYGASAPRYMPDPDEAEIGADERKKRAAMLKSARSLAPSHFGNRVTNFGDFSQIREDDIDGPVHLLIGGTPCQAFSVAGKRLGLDDPRGNLTLEFLALAKRVRAEWLAWENVPGFLSHDEGRTMGTFLRILGELGYGWAYRVLDVQYIRVDGYERAIPQRRKRVILVAHLGDAAGPAAVLFDRESLRGDPAPRRDARQDVTPTISARTKGGGALGTDFDLDGGLIPSVASTLPAGGNSTGGIRQPGTSAETAATMLIPVAFGGGRTAGPIEIATAQTAHGTRLDFDSETFIAQPVAASLTRGAESSGKGGYAGRRQEDDVNIVAFSLRGRDGSPQAEPAEPAEPGLSPSLRAVGGGSSHAFVAAPVAFVQNSRDEVRLFGEDGQTVGALAADAGMKQQCYIAQEWAVRRLIPVECERLMGVPDQFTNITFRGKPASDGPRYKALGNSQGANKMRWLAHGLRDVMAAQ